MFSSKRERSGAELLPSSGEALTERLDMLFSTVSSTAAGLAKTDGEITGLRRELGNGLARIEELAAEMRSRGRASDVRELEKKVNTLAFESSKTSDTKRLDDLGSKVSVLAERVDTLASTVAATAASIAGRDGEIASLRRTVGERARGGPGVDEATLRRVEDAAAASASASMRVESYGDRIAELETRFDALGGQVSELTARMDTGERERAALATSVTDAATARRLEAEHALTSLGERLDAVEQRCAAITSELTRATSLWPSALRSLESKIEELARTSRPAENDGRGQHDVDASLLAALRTLEQRIERSDRAAREEREAVLERLERLTGHPEPQPDLLPIGADVSRFRASP